MKDKIYDLKKAIEELNKFDGTVFESKFYKSFIDFLEALDDELSYIDRRMEMIADSEY